MFNLNAVLSFCCLLSAVADLNKKALKLSFITSRMRIMHTASVMFSEFLFTFEGSGHMHYLANVPGHEHFLCKDPPPPGMSTFWMTSARYAIDIQIAFLLTFNFGMIGIHILSHSSSRKGHLLVKFTRLADKKECNIPITIPTHG